MPPHLPPAWTTAELEADRQKAIDIFVKLRRKESQTLFGNEWHTAMTWVSNLFQVTADLTNLDPDALLPDDPSPAGSDYHGQQRLAVLRFLSGVPVSEDDLRTAVDDRLGRRVLPADVRARAMQTIEPVIDRIRVPWIDDGRAPTPAERDRAMSWTAGLMAMERRRTARRGQASKLQETCIGKLLKHCGYTLADRTQVPSPIAFAHQLPVGHYLREHQVAGAKCDLPVRLRDGRLMTIECKSSNSAVNSIKRLSREVGGKAGTWRQAFGNAGFTVAVIAGVYDLNTLADAQNRHVSIFWQHDLRKLIDFLRLAV